MYIIARSEVSFRHMTEVPELDRSHKHREWWTDRCAEMHRSYEDYKEKYLEDPDAYWDQRPKGFSESPKRRYNTVLAQSIEFFRFAATSIQSSTSKRNQHKSSERDFWTKLVSLPLKARHERTLWDVVPTLKALDKDFKIDKTKARALCLTSEDINFIRAQQQRIWPECYGLWEGRSTVFFERWDKFALALDQSAKKQLPFFMGWATNWDEIYTPFFRKFTKMSPSDYVAIGYDSRFELD